jgi:hypothetical protein
MYYLILQSSKINKKVKLKLQSGVYTEYGFYLKHPYCLIVTYINNYV